jgi:CRP-like cAMP-binding protein
LKIMVELLTDKMKIIARFSLFSGLTEDCLLDVARISTRKSIRKEETLFTEGQDTKGLYLLLDGKIKLIRISSKGQEQILHFVFPGQSFAEGALFDDEKYPATARTVSDSSLLFIPKAGFCGMLETNHQLASNLFSHLSRRLRFMARKVEELTLLNATSRVCRHLITLWDKESNQIVFPVTMKHTAQSLGMVVETFSRVLHKLKKNGVVGNVAPGVLQVMDPEALEDCAG